MIGGDLNVSVCLRLPRAGALQSLPHSRGRDFRQQRPRWDVPREVGIQAAQAGHPRSHVNVSIVQQNETGKVRATSQGSPLCTEHQPIFSNVL